MDECHPGIVACLYILPLRQPSDMLTEPRVFDESYLPRELLHREGAVDTLSRAFEPTTVGEPADDVLISGPSGVGKTVLARHTLGKLDRHATGYHAHVRCLGTTTGDVLRSILVQHPRADDPVGNEPVDDLVVQLSDVVDEPLIVVLDEGDDLPQSDVLDVLGGLDGVSLVCICHDETAWLADAPDTIRERLTTTIQLDRYGVDELADILQRRAIQGLASGAVRRRQLETIADRVAGVAREGIQTLRGAAEVANERAHRKIKDDDIEPGHERALRRIRQANLRSLPFHHHVLYELIRVYGPLTAAELNERYEEVAPDVYTDQGCCPIGKRARRKKRAKLEDYDLIESNSQSVHASYSVCDEEVTSPLDII